MKNLFLSVFVTIIFIKAYSQNTNQAEAKYTANNKGKFYIYWGGNRESYSKSDIHFKGADYDFTLYDVTAHDKPLGWHLNYINPTRLTIPQTNFRMGYFINNHYNISIGFDHMKYVMFQDKAVNSSGYYPNPGTYGESFLNNQILLTEDFLTFEHTDGLNYINTEIARVDDLSKFIGLPNTDKFQINLTEGFGVGILFPRTDATLLGKDRHDEFHVSGYGVSAKAGLNLTFYKHFFIQTELKGGYINMPDIRTTNDSADTASQHLLFFQKIIAVGGIFKI
jgi:hypothetical protein